MFCGIYYCSESQSEKPKKRKTDKYGHPARELKKLKNIKVTEILIVFGTLGTIFKSFIKGRNCKSEEELKSYRQQKSIGDLQRFAVARQSANTGVKNLRGTNLRINNNEDESEVEISSRSQKQCNTTVNDVQKPEELYA